MSSDLGTERAAANSKGPSTSTPWQALLQAQGREEFCEQNPKAKLITPSCTINQLIHLPFSCQGWKLYTNYPWQDTHFHVLLLHLSCKQRRYLIFSYSFGVHTLSVTKLLLKLEMLKVWAKAEMKHLPKERCSCGNGRTPNACQFPLSQFAAVSDSSL